MVKIHKMDRGVSNWLFIGVVLVFFQVVIGGVTRLTDSGLSITDWAIIQGTIPPLNETEWNIAFEEYKTHASKQYLSLHADMSVQEFKVIYFWEYFHRLWARMMGFVFLFPFIYFVIKKRLSKQIIRRLGVVILLAMCAATFGWIMVDSGLNDDNRTWVSAYKLIIHLGIATTLIGYLYKTYLLSKQESIQDLGFFHSLSSSNSIKELKWGRIILLVLFVQILFGGLMAGMRAGLVHPHFPFFIQFDKLLYSLNAGQLSGTSVLDYEPNLQIKGIVQVVHRLFAYVLVIISGIFFLQLRRFNALSKPAIFYFSILGLQFLLGVLTVINSIGKIPVFYGAAHQAVALVLLLSLIRLNHNFLVLNK